MAINLRAPLVLTQGLLAQLPAAGEANIVNLIDARVLNLTPHYTSYTISKAGLWVLTQHLARALAPRVRVNAIAPGPVLPHAGMSEEAFAALARATPLGRGPSVEEICRALRAILEAPAMTGSAAGPGRRPAPRLAPAWRARYARADGLNEACAIAAP